MDFLAALGGLDALIPQNLADEVEPTTGLGRVCQAVDAGGPQGADGPALAQTVTVDELLQRGLVGAVVARGPERVGLVQQAVVEDDLVDGASRDKDEPRYARL